MTSGSETVPERQRKELAFEAGIWEWVRGNSRRPGAPFGGDGHAVELAATRLREEQAFIQESCKSGGIPYRGKVFWQLYSDVAAQSLTPLGRRRHGDVRRRVSCYASIDTDLIAWIEAQCEPKGPFASMNHLVETGFRVLRQAEADAGPVHAGQAFPFDGKALFKGYQRLLDA